MKVDFSKYALAIRTLDEWVFKTNPTTQTLKKHVEEAVQGVLAYFVKGGLLPSELLKFP